MQNASFLSPTRIVIGRAAEEQVGELVRQGDTVLIKGSRGMALEDVAERLRGSERN